MRKSINWIVNYFVIEWDGLSVFASPCGRHREDERKLCRDLEGW